MSEKEQIGDGGIPNRYWVRWNNDYYIKQPHMTELASKLEGFEVTNEVSKPFKTYRSARIFFDNIKLTFPETTSKFIEDRTLDEVASQILVLVSETGEFIKLLKEKMKKRR